MTSLNIHYQRNEIYINNNSSKKLRHNLKWNALEGRRTEALDVEVTGNRTNTGVGTQGHAAKNQQVLEPVHTPITFHTVEVAPPAPAHSHWPLLSSVTLTQTSVSRHPLSNIFFGRNAERGDTIQLLP